MIRILTAGAGLAAIIAVTIAGCKPQMAEPISAVRDDAVATGLTKEEAMAKYEEYHSGYRCAGCHELSEVISDWALSTSSSYDNYVASAEASSAPPPAAIGGIYKAYLEAYDRHFTAEGDFLDWKDEAQEALQVPASMDMSKVRSRRAADGTRLRLDRTQHDADFAAMVSIMRAHALHITSQQGSGGTCETSISDVHKQHLQQMQTAGLQSQLNISRFYGCPRGNDPSKCFTSGFSDVSANASAGSWKVIEVASVGSTSFWTRSSMDGRFVANGGPARIDDLEQKVSWRIVGSSYDPGFFPNGRGFTFHGGSAVFCDMAAILGPNDPNDYKNWRDGLADTELGGKAGWKIVTLDPSTSEYCLSGEDSGGVNLYQSVGGGLDLDAKGYVVTGAHRNDSGGGNNDTANFSGDLRVHEIEQAPGTGFKTPVVVANFNLPAEGDYSLSPTSQFITGRYGIDGKQAGYRMRSLSYMLKKGDQAYSTADDPTVSTICMEGRGSKPMFSIDERFIAFHQYEDTGSGTAANVYVVDLLSENPQPVQVTKFTGNDKALFAHFRADGWLYWLFDDGSGDKTIHATDIAILMGK